MRIRRILVPTDFGRPAAAALDLAIEMARATGAALSIMHVSETGPELVATPGRSTTALCKSIRASADRELADAIERTRAALDDVDGVFCEGSPVRKILEVTRKRGFDLVIMGTHGRRGARRLFLGSVAEGVVRRTTIPVSTVRADRARSRVPKLWTEPDAEVARSI